MFKQKSIVVIGNDKSSVIFFCAKLMLLSRDAREWSILYARSNPLIQTIGREMLKDHEAKSGSRIRTHLLHEKHRRNTYIH